MGESEKWKRTVPKESGTGSSGTVLAYTRLVVGASFLESRRGWKCYCRACGMDLLPLIHRNVGDRLFDALVGGADDARVAVEFFEAVGAPAGDSADGEKRGKELGGDIEHLVDKARIEVHVRWEREFGMVAFHMELAADSGDIVEQVEFLLVFRRLGGELSCLFAQDFGTGVGDLVDGVAEAVDETGVVESLFIEDFGKVIGELRFV